MIGNDIVDLSIAEKESNWCRKNFLKKLFTDNEQRLIFSSKNPFNLVWRFWSMKEAAYKIYTQINGTRFFAPKKFDCLILSQVEGLVYFNNEIFYTISILNNNFISSIAYTDKNINTYTEFVKPKYINSKIKIKLEELTQFSSSKIKQKKLKNGAPIYYHEDTILTKSCSISHHGNYGIFSIINY